MTDHPYKIEVEAERRLLGLMKEAQGMRLVPKVGLRCQVARLMRNLAEHLEPEATAPVLRRRKAL